MSKRITIAQTGWKIKRKKEQEDNNDIDWVDNIEKKKYTEKVGGPVLPIFHGRHMMMIVSGHERYRSKSNRGFGLLSLVQGPG